MCIRHTSAHAKVLHWKYTIVALFRNNTKEKSVLACVIESGAVRLALSLVRSNAVPLCVFEAAEQIPLQKEVSAERLRTLIIESLEKVAERLVREGFPHVASRALKNGRVNELHITYASPWYLSQTKTITITNEEPFTLTEKVVREVVDREVQGMLAGKGKNEFGGASGDLSIIEERITNIRLNGYPTNSPYGKKTDRAALTLFVSALPRNFREAVEGALERHVSAALTFHHSLPLMLFSGIRDTYAAERDFVVACIGDEVTDVAYARDETLSDTGSFPFGRSHLIRRTAKDLSRTTEEASSLVDVTTHEHLDEAARAGSAKVVGSNAGAWTDELMKTLMHMLPSGNIPKTLFLIAGSESGAVQNALQTGTYAASRHGAPLEVVELTGNALKPFVKTGGSVRSVDPRLLFAMLYAQKVGSSEA